MVVIEKSTKQRGKQMENIKDLFVSIRKGLENFSAHMTRSTQLFYNKQRTLSSTYAASKEEDVIVTTLGVALDNFVKTMQEMAKDVRQKSEMLFKDLIEPSDLYIKHYSATNNILLEQAG